MNQGMILTLPVASGFPTTPNVTLPFVARTWWFKMFTVAEGELLISFDGTTVHAAIKAAQTLLESERLSVLQASNKVWFRLTTPGNDDAKVELNARG